MKILAIRGRNLASLEEFAINFQEKRLASTGLFAIYGPTGSGKSTILDALCLALYDKTPRLNRERADNIDLPDVGNDTIPHRDPRRLLRHGTGDGFAEVDFVGNDGVEYRARWSVRRGYRKADASLQETEMTLQTLSDQQRIGGRKGEVLKEIVKILGLEFDQFTRAVLLAQNEFAAFLKAKEDHRASLLQTLTGLKIYEKISSDAYKRVKLEREALKTLNDRFEGQQPLSTEARAQLDQALSTAKKETAQLEKRKTDLDQQLQWHEQWEKLKQDEQQAVEAVQQTHAAQNDAEPRTTYLVRVEAVRDSRSLLGEMDRAAGDVEKNHQAVSDAERKRDDAWQIRQQADEALAKAQQRVADAAQARLAVGPDLELAKGLEWEINTLEPGRADALKKRNEACNDEAKAQQALAGKQTERRQTSQVLQTAQDWLTAHESLRVLAENWPLWEVLFNQAAAAQASLCDIERNITVCRQDEQQKQQMCDQAVSALDKAEATFQAAEAQLQKATQTLTGVDGEMLAMRRATTESRRDRLDEAKSLWTALADSLTRQQELNTETSVMKEKIAQAETVLAQLHAEQPVTMARLEQAEKSQKIAEITCAKNVETLRDTLESGSPCPVCGATEHPYAAGDAPSRALLASLKIEVDQYREARDTLVRQKSSLQTILDSSRQQLMVIDQKREPLVVVIARNTALWNAQPLAAELTAVANEDRLAWFAAQTQQIRQQIDVIAKQQNAQDQAIKIRDKAQQAQDQAQQRYSPARDTRNAMLTALDQVATAIKVATDRQNEAAQQLNNRLNDLDPALPNMDWRPAWEKDSSAFYQQQQQQATQWSKQRKQAEELQGRLDNLVIEINNLSGIAADKTAQLQRATADFENADRNLQDKRQQRQSLFNGRPVVEVEKVLDKAITDARILLKQQEQAAQKARDDDTQAATALNAAQQYLIVANNTVEKSNIALNDWIVTFNADHPEKLLDLNQLRALLFHDNEWIQQEQGALQKLIADVRNAEATLKERQLQRENHEQQRTSLDSVETVQAVKKQTIEYLETGKDRYFRAQIDLDKDDERRKTVADLQNAITKQTTTTEIWEKLNTLIGSSDGKKFPYYAQQLTLDVLLGYANHHLASLSRRYRLERVKDTLALMVIDQDMGDECRSVHSLSGGESFLVSLALALGLASLSSNRIRVESLFIDEGFGSLDADTLRVAMDALDQLQAQGRKVGVISHVQEMTERIGVQIQVQRQSGGQSRVEVRNI